MISFEGNHHLFLNSLPIHAPIPRLRASRSESCPVLQPSLCNVSLISNAHNSAWLSKNNHSESEHILNSIWHSVSHSRECGFPHLQRQSSPCISVRFHSYVETIKCRAVQCQSFINKPGSWARCNNRQTSALATPFCDALRKPRSPPVRSFEHHTVVQICMSPPTFLYTIEQLKSNRVKNRNSSFLPAYEMLGL